MLGNTVECQARLVGDDVEVLTDSLGGFLDLEAQIRLRDILVISPVFFLSFLPCFRAQNRYEK